MATFCRILILFFHIAGLFVRIHGQSLLGIFVTRLFARHLFPVIVFSRHFGVNSLVLFAFSLLAFGHGTHLAYNTRPTKHKYNHKRDNQNTYNPNRAYVSPQGGNDLFSGCPSQRKGKLQRNDGLEIGTKEGYPKRHRGGEKQALERRDSAPTQNKSEANTQHKNGQEETSQPQESIYETIGNACAQETRAVANALGSILAHNELGGILCAM